LTNNRIGRYKIPEGECDPDYVQYDRRWGKETPKSPPSSPSAFKAAGSEKKPS